MLSLLRARWVAIAFFIVTAVLGLAAFVLSATYTEIFVPLRLTTQTKHLTGWLGSLAFLALNSRYRFLHDRYLYMSIAFGLLTWNLSVSLLHVTAWVDPMWKEIPTSHFMVLILKSLFCFALFTQAYQLKDQDAAKNNDFLLPVCFSSALIALATWFSFKIQTDEFQIVGNAQVNFQASFKQAVREVLEKEVIPLRLLLSIKTQTHSQLYDGAYTASRGVLAASDSLLALTLISKDFEPQWSAQKYAHQSFALHYQDVIRSNREELDSGQMIFADNPFLERRNQVEIVVPYFKDASVRAYLVAVFDFEKVIRSVALSFVDTSFGYRLWGSQGDILIDEKTYNPLPFLAKQSSFGFARKGFVLETFPHVSGALALTSVVPQSLMLINFALAIFLSQLFMLYKKLARSYDLVETEVKLRTQELAQEKQRAEVANEAKTQFLANISHEVRTPLNVVMGVIDLLKDTKLDENQNRFVLMLKQSSENMLHLVNDFLDLSKIEQGQVQLEQRMFDAQVVVSEMVSLHRIKAQEKGLNVIFNENIEHMGWYIGDSYRLRQILSNLISNAIKFTEHGSITLFFEYKKDGLHFTVRDTGVGIPEEKLPIIFERFTQVDASPSRRRAGTGLGLSITKKLVDLMKGSIEVSSELDVGTEFQVYLALPPTSEARVVDTNLSAELEEQSNLYKMRLLIVDDSSENRELLKLFLKKELCEITEAENGEQAYNFMRDKVFDLVLMDLQMPIMDGYTAVQKIRHYEQEESNGKRRTIVALTAHAMNEDREKCLQQGFDAYLSKPIRRDELIREFKKYRSQVSAQVVEQKVFPVSSK